jgi:rSAM/selenodomain-associated transferase 2
MLLSVVIPTLNEAHTLPQLLDDLQQVSLSLETVVADGGSTDGTASVAGARGARVVNAPQGRGVQMNAGADGARGTWLLFLHADVRVPEAARSELARAVDRGVDAAVWSLVIDAGGTWPRVMEFGARARDRLGGLPYGDQGLLVRRTVFEEVGGYPEVPIMEDVAMVRSLTKRVHLERLGAPVVVSPRRWERQGPYRTWLRNSALITAYHLGVSPHRLARWYRADVL